MRIASLAFAIFLAASARAGLRWETNLIERATRPGTERVEGRFRFENTGAGPVTIRKISTSCGCTTAQLVKKTFAPGEKGELVAVFEPGDRTGEQMKTLRVETDDGARVLLGLKVQIEPTVELDRTVLLWRKGDPPLPQVVTVTALREAPLAFTKAKSDSAGFRAEVESVEPGRLFRVRVTPENTAERAATTVRLLFDNPDEYGADALLRARIK